MLLFGDEMTIQFGPSFERLHEAQLVSEEPAHFPRFVIEAKIGLRLLTFVNKSIQRLKASILCLMSVRFEDDLKLLVYGYYWLRYSGSTKSFLVIQLLFKIHGVYIDVVVQTSGI